MGILEDFINNIKRQREQYKAEQKRAAEENKARALRKQEGTEKKQTAAEVISERVKEQRKEFKEAQQKGKEAPKGPVVQEQKPADTVMLFNHTFMHTPGNPPHVWLDDAAKAVYIDDIDGYLKSGGKIEVRGITSAMDQYMYDIYTPKGGPIGQARYYRQENTVISIVPDPFAKYRR